VGTDEYSIWIEATPAQVWLVYVDPERIPDWQTGRPVIVDVHGAPGEVGSTYRSKRGPLVAQTTVRASDTGRELVTSTDAYVGLRFEVTSRLTERSGGTDLGLRVVTHWPRGLAPFGKLVELAVLSRREAIKELRSLKSLVEAER